MKKFLIRVCIILLITILLSLLLITYINEQTHIRLNIDFDPSLTLGEKGYIAEIATESAEVFNFNTLDDSSDCKYSNLPKGTLDYCSKKSFNCSDENINKKFRLLNSGKRVYSKTKDGDCGLTDEYLNLYYDKLPTSNKITINNMTENDRHTYIYFGTLWKAPFTIELSSEGLYGNIDEAKHEYLDITFDYCNELNGSLELFDNEVFGGYAIIKNEDNCTLRLYLKNVGKFFGYGSYYDDDGILVMYFLNPPEIIKADNEYGYSLENTLIVLDSGHGGSALGAKNYLDEVLYFEKNINLDFSFILAEKLRDIGAEVILTRENDIDLTLYKRANLVRCVKPDLFISLHRNANTDKSVQGYENYYFTDYSLSLAKALSASCGYLFENNRGIKNTPAMYVTRISECPAILSEDGFISNESELSNIITDNNMNNLADAYVHAIIEYMVYSN